MQKIFKSSLILLSFLFIFNIILQLPAVKASDDILIIKVSNLNARSGPGLEYNILATVNKDDLYSFSEEKNGWYKIKINNTDGWVAGWLAEPIVKTTYNSVKSNIVDMNVRSGPSTTLPVLAQIQPDVEYLLLEDDGEWLKIQLNTTQIGWVAKWLITIIRDSSSITPAHNESVKINADILNVRSKPLNNAEVIGKLTMGTQIKIIGIEEGWYKIEYKDSFGWIASEFTNKDDRDVKIETSEIPEQKVIVESNKIVTNKPTVTILNPGTNLREGPSTTYPVMAIANNGDQFPITETENGWYQLLLPDGNRAYVAGWIVTTKGIDNVINHGINELLKNRVIIIDAGHGGKDIGASGANFNTIEKELNLSIALILQKKLEATGAKVIMTRTKDETVSLQQRVDTSIYNDADIFISLHHNTNLDYSLNGAITYYYGKDDKRLADIVHSELIKYNSLDNLNVRYGDYFLLRENNSPSIIIEAAFISNYHDELKVKSNKYFDNVAEGIFQGIIKYFNAI